MNRNFHGHSQQDSAGDGGLDSVQAQLDALGARYAHEAQARGVAERVFQASLPELTGESRPVLARIGWTRWATRWAGGFAAAALIGVAAMVPLGVFTPRGGPANDTDVVLAFTQPELAPASLSERMMAGLINDEAAFASFDADGNEAIGFVIMSRGHRADQVRGEIEELLALGGEP